MKNLAQEQVKHDECHNKIDDNETKVSWCKPEDRPSNRFNNLVGWEILLITVTQFSTIYQESSRVFLAQKIVS